MTTMIFSSGLNLAISVQNSILERIWQNIPYLIGFN